MKVVKRNGEFEDVSFDKVLKRLQQKSHGLNVDVFDIAQKVVSRIYDGVNTLSWMNWRHSYVVV